ncbi:MULTISPECIES: alpha/beta hydrolase [unclassified Arenibacter]|uniref:alpha/beta hydrolase n=1 Tax=unclassified Arenibacter TaxID=2615047 RepID=UPI000E34333E|nr:MULTISPECIES: alpha/beta hydrolase [unclassified Arenibacter]MCM4162191.1 esterase [Arenibacter sp. A80]RFT57803.1 alpha/beta hydrolase [Arenibacter sp. P308M17]
MKPFHFLLSCLFTMTTFAQNTVLPLWPNDIPNTIKTNEKEEAISADIVRIAKVQIPELEVYLPSKKNATGQAVLIFPGGGYGILAYDWEGTDFAKFLNSKGIAGIVVKYRLPSAKSQTNMHIVPLQDAQRAMRTVRSRATEWNIDPRNIGIIGFSAGGHLASTLGTHFNENVYPKKDVIDEQSARPDFMTLAYPVITMGEPNTHGGSRKNLLGENPSQKMLDHFSNELQVTADTPPTFLVHATDDTAVPVENSLLFYTALVQHQVPAEMHIYPTGGHGFALGLNDPHLASWTDQWVGWLNTLKR